MQERRWLFLELVPWMHSRAQNWMCGWKVKIQMISLYQRIGADVINTLMNRSACKLNLPNKIRPSWIKVITSIHFHPPAFPACSPAWAVMCRRLLHEKWGAERHRDTWWPARASWTQQESLAARGLRRERWEREMRWDYKYQAGNLRIWRRRRERR